MRSSMTSSIGATRMTLRPPARTLFSFFFLLLLLFASHYSSCAAASGTAAEGSKPVLGDDAPPTPVWSYDCPSPYQRCATVKVHPDWEHPARRADADKDNNQRLFYTLRVEAIFKNPDNQVTAWYVGDTISSDTLHSFVETAQVNVVVVSPRGGRDAKPSLTCGGDDVKLDPTRCWPTPACAAKLKSQLDQRTSHFNNYTLNDADVVDLGLFALDQHAADLEFVIGQLTPANGQNIIIAEGLRGAVVMRYLARSPDRTNPAVMFINPPPSPEHYHFLGGNGGNSTSPSSPSLSFYGPALDAALQRLFTLCDQDATCSYRLGATEGGWSRYLNIKRSLENGLLPCVEQLEWGSSTPAANDKTQMNHHSSVFENGYSSRWRSGNGPVVAEALQYMLFYIFYQRGIAAATEPQLLSIVPSILYRLQRCDAGDVKALNTLYTYLYPFINSEGVTKAPGSDRGGCAEADVMHKYVWLLNDFQTNNKNGDAGATTLGDDTNVNVPINFDRTKFEKLSGSKYRNLFEQQEGQTLYPPQEALKVLQSVAANFPGYTNANSVRTDIARIASTKAKVLLFFSDLDIFFPLSATTQLLGSYGTNGGYVQLRYMRGSGHLPLSGNSITSCIVQNLKAFKETFQFAGPEVCLPSGERSASYASCSAATAAASTLGSPLLGEDVHRQHVLQFINVDGATYYGINDVWQFTRPNPREPLEGRAAANRSFLGKVWHGLLTLMLWLFYLVCAIGVGYGLFFLFWRFQYICCHGGSSGGELRMGDGVINNGYSESWSEDVSRYNLEGLPPQNDSTGDDFGHRSSITGLADRVRSLFGQGNRSYSQTGATDADFFSLVRQQSV